MIQRIQSIFLFLVAVAMLAVIFAPIGEGHSEDVSAVLTAMEMTITKGTEVSTVNTMAIAIFSGLSFALALFSLFSFKNRIKQVAINTGNSAVITIVIGLIAYYGYYEGNAVVGAGKFTFQVGLALPAIAAILNKLASRFIKKDEKKVKDSISGRLRD